ncbi:MAG: hypothetical protein H6862_01195 [Rhodospirillales bacterium]|nr:hypothetical protein [Rhodospirillales bacterium]
MPIKAALGAGGSGDEILTVTVTGISPTWTITNANGTYTPATGTWTITLPPGTNYNGGLTFAPPANSDADLSGLKATASAFEPVTSTHAESLDNFHIITDAVADLPALSVDCDGYLGTSAGVARFALNIQAGVTDTDGSESITKIVISNMPSTWSLSAGTHMPDGTWQLSQDQLVGLKIYVPLQSTPIYQTLTITAWSGETHLSGVEVDYTDNAAHTAGTLTFNLAAHSDTNTNININVNTNTNTNVSINENSNSTSTSTSTTTTASENNILYTGADDLFLPLHSSSDPGTPPPGSPIALSDVLHQPGALSDAINDFVYGSIQNTAANTNNNSNSNMNVNGNILDFPDLDLLHTTGVVA